jgi:hypothetical protein
VFVVIKVDCEGRRRRVPYYVHSQPIQVLHGLFNTVFATGVSSTRPLAPIRQARATTFPRVIYPTLLQEEYVSDKTQSKLRFRRYNSMQSKLARIQIYAALGLGCFSTQLRKLSQIFRSLRESI